MLVTSKNMLVATLVVVVASTSSSTGGSSSCRNVYLYIVQFMLPLLPASLPVGLFL